MRGIARERFKHSLKCGLSHLQIPSILLLLLLISAVYSASNNQTFHSVASSSSSYSAPALSPVTEVRLPRNGTYPLGITTDARGNVWFGEANTQSIAEYIVSNQTFRTFKLPTNVTGLTMIWFLIFDKGGYLWFADQSQPLLWRFDPITDKFANFSTGQDSVWPYGLAYDPSSNQIWFTSTYTNQIGHFQIGNDENATLEGLVTAPSIGSKNSGPSGIAISPGGDRIFFSQPFTSSIAEYDTATQRFEHVWQLPNGTQPVGMYFDAERNLVWFTDHGASLFGFVNLTDDQVREYSTSLFHYTQPNGDVIQAITLPYWISGSAGGMIWFNEHIGDKIARFDLSTRTLTEFQVPTLSAEPLRFYIDNSSKMLWFTEFSGDKIGSLELNSSLVSEPFLRNQSVTLSAGPAQVIADFPASLLNSSSFSGTLTPIGDVSGNLTISVSGPASSSTPSASSTITIGRGPSLLEGNYTLTVCNGGPAEPSLPVKQCGVLLLNVPAAQGHNSLGAFWLYLIAALVIAGTAAASIFIVRRWRF